MKQEWSQEAEPVEKEYYEDQVSWCVNPLSYCMKTPCCAGLIRVFPQYERAFSAFCPGQVTWEIFTCPLFACNVKSRPAKLPKDAGIICAEIEYCAKGTKWVVV